MDDDFSLPTLPLHSSINRDLVIAFITRKRGYLPLEIVEQMLVKGADTEVANRLGWTALHLAVRNGHLECATVLLEAGASVQRQGGFSETALHIAAYNADQKMIQLLIDQGQGSQVACARQNQFGLTALDAARDHCKGRALRILEDFAADAQAPRSSGRNESRYNAHVDAAGVSSSY